MNNLQQEKFFINSYCILQRYIHLLRKNNFLMYSQNLIKSQDSKNYIKKLNKTLGFFLFSSTLKFELGELKNKLFGVYFV